MDMNDMTFVKPVIAIILPETARADYNTCTAKLQKLIREAGGIALICSDNYESRYLEELIDYYISYVNVNGMFVFGLETGLRKKYDIPVISMFSSCDNVTDSIEIDEETYASEILNYLSSLGHERVGIIGENFTAKQSEAFQRIITKMNQSIYYSIYSAMDSVEDCVEQILCIENRPTAIVCEYDYIAVGVIQYLNKKGYIVPKDFTVISRDFTNISRYMNYSLTTANLNLGDICDLAWNLMQQRLDRRYNSLYQRIVINCKQIIGETAASPGDKR